MTIGASGDLPTDALGSGAVENPPLRAGEGEGEAADTDTDVDVLEAAEIIELASAGLSVIVEDEETGVGLLTLNRAS